MKDNPELKASEDELTKHELLKRAGLLHEPSEEDIKKACATWKPFNYDENRSLELELELAEKKALKLVKQNGYALKDVINQTDAICRAAVKENGLALRLVKNQTKSICRAAIRGNRSAFHCIRDFDLFEELFNEWIDWNFN